MSEKGNNMSIWAALSFVTLLAVILCLFIWGVAGAFKYLESPALSSTITVSGTILVAVITVVVAKYIENKQKINHEIRQKKIPVYEEHVGVIFSSFMGEKLKKRKLTDTQLLEAFVTFTEKLVLWGSSDVIKSWGKIRTGFGDLKTAEQITVLADFIRTLRKDVGISDDLTDKEILNLFINDLEEHIS